MNGEKDSLKKNVYNVQQLAVKVVANSIYGQTGAGVSQIFCIDIAESTTCYGR
jgi:DNA polymerase delta subunit 1